MSDRSFHGGRVRLLAGDCLARLDDLADASVDAVVCDPPYHLTANKKGGSGVASVNLESPYGRARIGTGNGSGGFMGKAWDGGDIAFRSEVWAKVLRVLKPGGHLVAFSGTRTYHRMVCAIEDAGFEIRDQIGWAYGQGFPKSSNQHGDWEGWGTALKPAWEPICVARKPLIGTVEENLAAHGVGALNIDGCRIPTGDKLGGGAETGTMPEQKGNEGWARPWMDDETAREAHASRIRANVEKAQVLGRWPANLCHDGSDEVLAGFPDAGGGYGNQAPRDGGIWDGGSGFKNDGREFGYGDSGSAARFFYCAKANAADRLGSKHPTVKPIDLMRWLVRLVTPPRGLLLDPFAGTGTTAHAALLEGFDAILIEREAEYQADVERRMGLVFASPAERKRAATKAATAKENLPLFGGPV